MDEPLHPVQLEAFRRMPPKEKLRRVCELYEAGVQLRMAGLRAAHPDWPTERLERLALPYLLSAFPGDRHYVPPLEAGRDPEASFAATLRC